MINNIMSCNHYKYSIFVAKNTGGGEVAEYQYDKIHCNAYDYRLSYLPVF